MKEQSLESFFLSEIKDIFHAEQQLVIALPKAIKAAGSADLKEALANHLEETRVQVERLKEIFELFQLAARGKQCHAMKGLVQECEELIEDYEYSPLRDAGIISKCQRIEHYEMATYESLKHFAQEMEINRAVDLLQATLDEEINANKLLSKLAEGGILSSGLNAKASRK